MRHGITTSFEFGGSGICAELECLHWLDIITESELYWMELFIEDSKPNSEQYTEFTKLDCWRNNMYWWVPVYQDESTIQVRVDYLNELITTIKERN